MKYVIIVKTIREFDSSEIARVKRDLQDVLYSLADEWQDYPFIESIEPVITQAVRELKEANHAGDR